MKNSTQSTTIHALWLSDLHLDRTSERRRQRLYDRIKRTKSRCVFVTGDISNASELQGHLSQLAAACAPRPLFFVPGNHDFHGGAILEVKDSLRSLSESIGNLHHLDGRKIIRLGRGTGLIGCHGWADARAGHGQATTVDNPDRHAIRDFDGMDLPQYLSAARSLGLESARTIRHLLPLALTIHQHVVVLAHVPPYPETAQYNGRPCGPGHAPHFSNLSAGLTILGIARAFPRRSITVLAGHSHSACEKRIRPNLLVRVAPARTGQPDAGTILQL